MYDRVGIIGLGNIGSLHKRIYEKLGVKDIKLLDPEKGYIDNMKDVEAISLCVPNIYKSLYLKLLDGRPILCEKPLPIEIGYNIFSGYVYRYRKGIEEFFDNSNLVLTILRKKAVFYSDWFKQKRISGGGVLMDLGSHLIDLGLYLQGTHDTRIIDSKLSDFRDGLEYEMDVTIKTHAGQFRVMAKWADADEDVFLINGKRFPMWVEEEAFERELKSFLNGEKQEHTQVSSIIREVYEKNGSKWILG